MINKHSLACRKFGLLALHKIKSTYMFFGVSRVFYLKEKSNTFIPTIKVGHQDTGTPGYWDTATMKHWDTGYSRTLGH